MISPDGPVDSNISGTHKGQLPEIILPSRARRQNFTARMRKDVAAHREVLTNTISQPELARPLIYVMLLPLVDPRPGTSASVNQAAVERFGEIEKELNHLADPSQMDDMVVERGAIDTAQLVISQIKANQLAPPEVSWLSTEAILMLWVLGDTRYAVTITDGEVGYIVRRYKETIKKLTNIPPNKLDLLRLV